MKQSASQDTKRPNLQRYFFTSSIHAGAVQSSVPSVTDTQAAATMSPLHWLLYVSGQYKLPLPLSSLSVTMTQLAANFTDIHFLTSVKKMPK